MSIVGNNYTNFNPQFRHNKFISNLESISEIISSDFDYRYYFIIARDTFYTNASDIINLPIIKFNYWKKLQLKVSLSSMQISTL